MRKATPRLELHLKSRKIIADGAEAIAAVWRPVQVLIYAIAIGLLVSSICFVAAVGYLRGWF
jgi:hypothetical protein